MAVLLLWWLEFGVVLARCDRHAVVRHHPSHRDPKAWRSEEEVSQSHGDRREKVVIARAGVPIQRR